MNNPLKNILSGSLLAAFALAFNPTLHAQMPPEDNLCTDTGIAFVFFNGVQTTVREANRANGELARIHGYANDEGDEIAYEVAYNYTEGFGDFIETFEQRLLEQDSELHGRFELFFESLRGDGPWWSIIGHALPQLVDIRDSWIDWNQAAIVQRLTSLFGSPPTEVNYAEHRVRIDNWIVEGKKLLFVAHSQGNLFANAAFGYASSQLPADAVKLVHIAPASPSLNGPHSLADLDLVINGLRVAGTVAPITDNIPGYLLRPAGVNGQKDILGHGLLEIYINQQLSIASRVKNHIDSALNSLVAPPAEASSGFFTATLTWNGSGDVDLHVHEPGGAHVYYSSMTGSSGFLDVDNTVANGPEHYYASCEAGRLQVGTYRVSVANYARATGRTATVQIASWEDGVLGTQAVTVAGPTGSTPGYTLFNVQIEQNPETGKFSASLTP